MTADQLHEEWLKNPEYRQEYEALEEEFLLLEQDIVNDRSTTTNSSL